MSSPIDHAAWPRRLLKQFLVCIILAIPTLIGCQPVNPQGDTVFTLSPSEQPGTTLSALQTPSPQLTTTSTSTATVEPYLPAIPTPLALPQFTRGFSLAFDRVRGEVVMFGGLQYPKCADCDETWVWDGLTWKQRQPQHRPPGRAGADLVYDDARREAVLFGSPTQLGKILNDTWAWNGQDWTEKHPAVSPPGRIGPYLVYDVAREVVLLFGGVVPDSGHGINFLNDTWLWDGENWKQADSPVSPPFPIGGKAYMTYDIAHQTVMLLVNNDTWIWDGEEWGRKHPETSPIFLSLNGSLGYDEKRQEVVFFGVDLNFRPQTWAWDGQDWHQIELNSQPWQDISEFHMIFDTKHQALLLFALGGDKTTGVSIFWVWIWTGRGWSRVY